MEEIHLPPEVFSVLVAVAWTDGRLDPQEVEAITRAAAEEGLSATEQATLKTALQTRRELGEINVSNLGTKQRLYLYAIATWVATLSYGINPKEWATLDALRTTLQVTPQEAEALNEVLCELMIKPQGMRPGRFDFAGLRHAVADRVDEAAAFTPMGGLNRPGSD